jgi:hypothetical protein
MRTLSSLFVVSLMFVASLASTIFAQESPKRPLPPPEFITGSIESIDADNSEITLRIKNFAEPRLADSFLTLNMEGCILVSGFHTPKVSRSFLRPQNPLYVEPTPAQVPENPGFPINMKTIRVGQAVEVAVRGYAARLVRVDGPATDPKKRIRRAIYIALLSEKTSPAR